MAWKKPKWVSNVQKSAQSAVNTVAAPVKQVVQTVAKALPPPPPKPAIVQTIQKAAQKAADTVGQGVKTAADKVGDVVRPAAQSVAKEVGSVVNPVLGEIKYRADEAGKNPVIQNIGNKIKEGVNTAQASANEMGAPLPFFTQIVPGAIKDTVYGVGDTLAGNVGKGLSKVGNSTLDVAKHAALGTLGIFGNYRGGGVNQPGGGAGAGRSGGAAVDAIPRPEEDTDDVPPPGAEKSPIGSSKVPNGGRPIPPVPTTGGPGSFLAGQPSKYKQMPKLRKKLRR